ncbi:MAG: Smr/MutS family protein [Pseudorhodobacter sp.]|nr:Smr/MutS family protein [Pseudorhodobacter sp.]
MSRRRTLRPEEEELWQAVARTANPMHVMPPRRKLDLAPPTPVLVHNPVPLRLPSFMLGEKVRKTVIHSLAPSLSESLEKAPILMDAKAHARMTRGKLQPEARIDLHGMTLAEAHPELIRFILNAHAAGCRLVLVITGKGKIKPDNGPIPQRMGVLRHQVPLWLRQIPLSNAVLQITESHLKHGGAGAYYVYLRRPR